MVRRAAGTPPSPGWRAASFRPRVRQALALALVSPSAAPLTYLATGPTRRRRHLPTSSMARPWGSSTCRRTRPPPTSRATGTFPPATPPRASTPALSADPATSNLEGHRYVPTGDTPERHRRAPRCRRPAHHPSTATATFATIDPPRASRAPRCRRPATTTLKATAFPTGDTPEGQQGTALSADPATTNLEGHRYFPTGDTPEGQQGTALSADPATTNLEGHRTFPPVTPPRASRAPCCRRTRPPPTSTSYTPPWTPR